MSTIQTTINVSGMSCDHCVNAVTSELTAIDGVSSVDVDLAAGAVTYESDRPIPDTEIAAAIDEAGFELAAPA